MTNLSQHPTSSLRMRFRTHLSPPFPPRNHSRVTHHWLLLPVCLPMSRRQPLLLLHLPTTRHQLFPLFCLLTTLPRSPHLLMTLIPLPRPPTTLSQPRNTPRLSLCVPGYSHSTGLRSLSPCRPLSIGKRSPEADTGWIWSKHTSNSNNCPSHQMYALLYSPNLVLMHICYQVPSSPPSFIPTSGSQHVDQNTSLRLRSYSFCP